MAKSIDVAVKLLEESIKLGKNDPRYYMDFVKLHKLMYLGYCSLSYLYNLELFEESITANNDGPYIAGLNAVPAFCGFGKIVSVADLKEYKLTLPLSFSRNEICELILKQYGMFDTNEVVNISKNTFAYMESFDKDQNNLINKILLTKTGEEISKVILNQQEQKGPVKKLTSPRNTGNK